jgi:hypothetical protein
MKHAREKIDPNDIELKDTVVAISRVTKVVKGGKNLSFSALVVVGDGHGVVGFGIGKAKEVPSAIKKDRGGQEDVARADGRTTIRIRLATGAGSALKPAPDGTGIIAAWSRGGRVGRHPQRDDEVAGIGQPAQRRAGGVRRPDAAEGSGVHREAARQGPRRDDGLRPFGDLVIW